jgi:methyl-accepting chemotaxis protein
MSLGLRIILVSVAASTFVALTLIAAFNLSHKKADARFAEAAITGKTVLWRQIVNSKGKEMQANMRTFLRDRELLQAIQVDDKETVAGAETTFNLLSSSEILSRLQFSNTEGRIIYSAPQVFDGVTKKASVTKAMETGKLVTGVERDDDGRLVYVLTFPMYIRSKVIGAGIFMNNLQPVLDSFKENDISDLFVLGLENKLEYSTNDELAGTLLKSGVSATEGRVVFKELGERAYSMVTQQLTDVGGNKVGTLISLKDRTDSYYGERRIERITYLVVFLSITLVAVIFFFYVKRLLAPLRHVSRALNEIAEGEGDLTRRLEVNGSDEVSHLALSFNQFAEQIYKLVKVARDDIEIIRDMAVHIADENRLLSTRTEEQTSGVESAVIAMDKLTSAVQHNAENAGKANELAADTTNTASNGALAITETIGAVTKIDESSGKMNNIVSTIDSIAFQTNLLALNASVEAARAGERGAGFAVVAQEVRNLAQRSAEAAKEISGLILENVDSAKIGSDSVEHSGEILGDISGKTRSVAQMLDSITEMSIEQADEIKEVNGVMRNLDSTVQQNARLVDKVAEASRTLERRAYELAELMGRFRLESDHAAPEHRSAQNDDTRQVVPISTAANK